MKKKTMCLIVEIPGCSEEARSSCSLSCMSAVFLIRICSWRESNAVEGERRENSSRGATSITKQQHSLWQNELTEINKAFNSHVFCSFKYRYLNICRSCSSLKECIFPFWVDQLAVKIILKFHFIYFIYKKGSTHYSIHKWIPELAQRPLSTVLSKIKTICETLWLWKCYQLHRSIQLIISESFNKFHQVGHKIFC